MSGVGSDPSFASVFGERGAHRFGLQLGLQLADQLRMTLRLAVNRVLQALDQLLEVGETRLERLQPFGLRVARLARRSIAGRGETTHLTQPRRQTIAVIGHRITGGVWTVRVEAGTAGVPPRSSGG